MSPTSKMLLFSAIILSLLHSTQGAGVICPRIKSCVADHQKDYATSYCASYLSISTQTQTVTVTGPTTVTATATTTSYTSTTTVIDDSVYESCGAGGNSNKKRTAAKIHSKPFCLRHFTQSTALSSACSCLSVATPSTTVSVSTTASTTTTTTVFAVATASTTVLALVDLAKNWTAYDGSSPGSAAAIFFDYENRISPYTLSSVNGTDCVLQNTFSGGICVQEPNNDNIVSCYSDYVPPRSSPLVVGALDPVTNQVSFTAGQTSVSYFVAIYGSAGIWGLTSGDPSNQFTVTAFGYYLGIFGSTQGGTSQ